jgi:hypothetical protein
LLFSTIAILSIVLLLVLIMTLKKRCTKQPDLSKMAKNQQDESEDAEEIDDTFGESPGQLNLTKPSTRNELAQFLSQIDDSSSVASLSLPNNP